MPELQLDKVMAARCLLLGSRTLGRAVSKALLGWGGEDYYPGGQWQGELQ